MSIQHVKDTVTLISNILFILQWLGLGFGGRYGDT